MIGPTALPAAGMKFIGPLSPSTDGRPSRGGHAAGRPGTGNRLTISLTSAARRAWADGSSRSRMASMMIRADRAHLVRPEPARGRRRRPDPDPGGGVRRERVERDRVLVDRDADLVEQVLGLLAGHPERRDVDEHEVVVGAARDDAGAEPGERLGHHGRVLDGPSLVRAERLLGGQLEGDGLGRDDLHERSALDPREGRPVDRGRQRAVGGAALHDREVGRVEAGPQRAPAEDHPATRTAQGLVGRGRHDVREREGARVDARRDEPGDVGHVDEQDGADILGDRGHPLEIPDPRVGGRPADDQLRADLLRLGGHRVVVDALRVLADAVGMDLVEPAGEVERHAVGQVSAVGQVHAHDPVARLEDAEVGDHVGLGARVGLDVDMLGAGVEREGAFLGQPLGDVDELAAAVVALAGQALGVLVGQPRALGFHHRGRHVVLAGDQLDLVVLATAFAEHRVPEDRVDLRDRLEREARCWRDRHGSPTPSCPKGRRRHRRRARAVSSHERDRRRDARSDRPEAEPMTHGFLDDPVAAGLETPAVVVDLDRVDARIARMAAVMRERGVALRPHVKTHKSLEFARRQIEAGAVGLTVATIGEAEVFADAGFDDIFIAYPVIALGPKADRLRRLGERCTLSVGADSVVGLEALAAAGGGEGAPAPWRVLIEIDSGGARTGVKPDLAGPLARRAVDLGLEVAGAFTHEGHGYKGVAARPAAGADAVAALSAAADSLRAEGIEPSVLSAGSTPTAELSAHGIVTEERPGTYLFSDRLQATLLGEAPEDVALMVLATVVSWGAGDGFVIDAGAKVLAKDVSPLTPGHGAIVGYPEGVVARLYDHHGVVELPAGSARPPVGSTVWVVPNHVCPVVNLVDEYVVASGGRVVDRWPVDARGRNA